MQLVLNVSGKEMTKAKEILTSYVGRSTSNAGRQTPDIFIIHPGAYKLNNRWPLKNYLEVGQKIQQSGKQVIFILGPAESEWKSQIEEQGFPVISGISVLEMAAILKLSSGVICNDTGVMHIAGGIGVKTLALFGDTYPERWKPPGPAVRVIQAPDKKLISITVADVLSLLSSH
jgi:ADP-heptose:LPS heptosyltransferase